MSSKSSKKPRGRSRRSCIACAGGIGESGSTTRILPQLRKALATFDRRAALEAFDPSVVRTVNIARNSQAAVLKQMETLRPAFAPGEPPRSPEEELGHLAQRSGLGVAYVLLSPVVALGTLGVPFLPVELRMALASCGWAAAVAMLPLARLERDLETDAVILRGFGRGRFRRARGDFRGVTLQAHPNPADSFSWAVELEPREASKKRETLGTFTQAEPA